MKRSQEDVRDVRDERDRRDATFGIRDPRCAMLETNP